MTTASIPEVAAYAYGLRGVVALILGLGLGWASDTEAEAVATIGATVVIVALIVSGIVTTAAASVARSQRVPGVAWRAAQGAVTLVLSLVFPVVAAGASLTEGPIVAWAATVIVLLSGACGWMADSAASSSSFASTSEILIGLSGIVVLLLKEETDFVSLMAIMSVACLLLAGFLFVAMLRSIGAPAK